MKINKIKAIIALLSVQISVFAISHKPIEAIGYKLIETEAQFNEIDKSKVPSIVMFSAPWCGPCKQMEPYFNQSAQENPSISFYKVDTSKTSLSKIVDEYEIKGLPTTVFVNKGEEVNRVSGGLRKQDIDREVSIFLENIKKPSVPKATTQAPATKANTQIPVPAPEKQISQSAPMCEKAIVILESDWNKIKKIIEDLKTPEYNELLKSAKPL